MELVMQPTFETCGQACIAMITSKDIEEVIFPASSVFTVARSAPAFAGVPVL